MVGQFMDYPWLSCWNRRELESELFELIVQKLCVSHRLPHRGETGSATTHNRLVETSSPRSGHNFDPPNLKAGKTWKMLESDTRKMVI